MTQVPSDAKAWKLSMGEKSLDRNFGQGEAYNQQK